MSELLVELDELEETDVELGDLVVPTPVLELVRDADELQDTTLVIADGPTSTLEIPGDQVDLLDDQLVMVTEEGDVETLILSTAGTPGPQGPRGERGYPGEAIPFEYVMPTAQTTALIDHTLGHDPVAVMVLVDGEVMSEYSIVPTIPNHQVRIGFDIAVLATIRLI